MRLTGLMTTAATALTFTAGAAFADNASQDEVLACLESNFGTPSVDQTNYYFEKSFVSGDTISGTTEVTIDRATVSQGEVLTVVGGANEDYVTISSGLPFNEAIYTAISANGATSMDDFGGLTEYIQASDRAKAAQCLDLS